MSTTDIHLLHYKIQSHLQKCRLWMPGNIGTHTKEKQSNISNITFCLFSHRNTFNWIATLSTLESTSLDETISCTSKWFILTHIMKNLEFVNLMCITHFSALKGVCTFRAEPVLQHFQQRNTGDFQHEGELKRLPWVYSLQHNHVGAEFPPPRDFRVGNFCWPTPRKERQGKKGKWSKKKKKRKITKGKVENWRWKEEKLQNEGSFFFFFFFLLFIFQYYWNFLGVHKNGN